jgi:hypothetical protein
MHKLTFLRASAGHGWNQSITLALTSPGKLRHLNRSLSPLGDIASTMWRLPLHFDKKSCQHASGVSCKPASFSSGLTLALQASTCVCVNASSVFVSAWSEQGDTLQTISYQCRSSITAHAHTLAQRIWSQSA